MTNAKPLDQETRDLAFKALNKAMADHRGHQGNAEFHLRRAHAVCHCAEDNAENGTEGCVCEDVDADAARTDAAIEARLAQAAATMVQAMATVLASNQL